MVTERPRMVRFRAVSFVAALFVVAVSFAACSQGVGERCELTSDCDDGLHCEGGDTLTSFMGGVCKPNTTGTGTGGSGGDGAGGTGGDSGGTGGGAGGGGAGALEVVELQPEGKRPMSLAEYRNGHPWSAGMRLDSIV